jgi:hypothetical protein
VALRREARRGRDFRQRLIRVGDQPAGALDPTLLHKRTGRPARRGPERARKVMNAQPGATGEITYVDRTFDIRLHEDLDAPECGWRQAASLMASPGCGGLVQPTS